MLRSVKSLRTQDKDVVMKKRNRNAAQNLGEGKRNNFFEK